MAFRFRKSIKLLPGLRLNLSRSGVSASIGKPGATINVGGKHGPRATIGVPGTGLSYTQRLSEPEKVQGMQPPQPDGRSGWPVGLILAAVAAVVLVLWLLS